MKYIYFGNNRLGLKVLEFLISKGDKPSALVVHGQKDAKYADEIRQVSGLCEDRIFFDEELSHENFVEKIVNLELKIGFSIAFGKIFSSELIKVFKRGIINLHTSLLPYNRGANPNIWSIVDKTPAGVSIHYVDEGVDTGDILFQFKVDIESVDTGRTLYEKLEKQAIELWKISWNKIKEGELRPIKQDLSQGTAHNVVDLKRLEQIDLNASYKAEDLINLLRAKSNDPYPGAYFVQNQKKIHMRLELEREQD